MKLLKLICTICFLSFLGNVSAQPAYSDKLFYGKWGVEKNGTKGIEQYEFLEKRVVNFLSVGNDVRQYKYEVKGDQIVIIRAPGVTIDRTILKVQPKRIELKDNFTGQTVILIKE